MLTESKYNREQSTNSEQLLFIFHIVSILKKSIFVENIIFSIFVWSRLETQARLFAIQEEKLNRRNKLEKNKFKMIKRRRELTSIFQHHLNQELVKFHQKKLTGLLMNFQIDVTLLAGWERFSEKKNLSAR